MACKRTSETIEIESLKFSTRNAGKIAQWPRCSFSANSVGKFESFGSGTSGNDVDNQPVMSGRQI